MNVNRCLACNKADLQILIDLGDQPAANLLTTSPSQVVKKVRLALSYCDNCGHAQQAEMYDPVELFSNYLYQSGTSNTLNNYFIWFANAVRNEAKKDAHVLEIACNDGTFLKHLASRGIKSTGVEPAENLAFLYEKENIELISDFWPTKKIKNAKYDRVIAMNVLAHGPDPRNFLKAVFEVLVNNGIAYIQVSQVDMFSNYEFDTLYHEHYSFFCANSFYTLAKSVGFTKIEFIKTNIHGGSLLAIIGFDSSPIESAVSNFEFGKFYIERIKTKDRPQFLDAIQFSRHSDELCETMRVITEFAKNQNFKIILVGVAAKAITFLQASKIKIDMVVDEAELKIDRYIPGSDYKIFDLTCIKEIDSSCLFVIGAWNFKSELSDKLRKIRSNKKDLVCTYFPKIIVSQLDISYGN